MWVGISSPSAARRDGLEEYQASANKGKELESPLKDEGSLAS